MRLSLEYDERLPLTERYKLKNKKGTMLQGSLYFIFEGLNDYVSRNSNVFYFLKMGIGLSYEQKHLARHILSNKLIRFAHSSN